MKDHEEQLNQKKMNLYPIKRVKKSKGNKNSSKQLQYWMDIVIATYAILSTITWANCTIQRSVKDY